jgi:hypothetical protein
LPPRTTMPASSRRHSRPHTGRPSFFRPVRVSSPTFSPPARRCKTAGRFSMHMPALHARACSPGNSARSDNGRWCGRRQARTLPTTGGPMLKANGRCGTSLRWIGCWSGRRRRRFSKETVLWKSNRTRPPANLPSRTRPSLPRRFRRHQRAPALVEYARNLPCQGPASESAPNTARHTVVVSVATISPTVVQQKHDPGLDRPGRQCLANCARH